MGRPSVNRLREREKKTFPKKDIYKYRRGEHINNKYKEPLKNFNIFFLFTLFFGWCVDGYGQVYDRAKRLSTISAWDTGSVASL